MDPPSSSSLPPDHPWDDEYDFHTITCVTWNAAGRNVGLGTPDGFLILSTESTLEDYITRTAPESHVHGAAPEPAASTNPGPLHGARPSTSVPHIVEVCRRVVAGGVGLLALCGQSSVVALSGVASPADAARVCLVDASRPLDSATVPVEGSGLDSAGEEGSSTARDPSGGGSSPSEHSSGGSRFGSEEEAEKAGKHGVAPYSGVCEGSDGPAPVRGVAKDESITHVLPADRNDLRSLVLAEATFPAAVSSLHFSPYFILVAVGGEPRIAGSHKLYVFDLRLQQKFVYSPQPLRSNRFFRDCVSLASSWALSSGAGVSIRRLRAVLPGPQRGSVRLLTLKRVTLLTAASTSARGRQSHTHLQRESTSPMPPEAHGSQPIHYSQLFLSQRQRQDHHARHDSGAAIHAEEEDESLIIGDKTLHEAPLRAVAISANGKYGVTIGERGTNIRLLEFVDDNKIERLMTLERGKTAAVVDSTSLHLITLPSTATASERQPSREKGDGGRTPHRYSGSGAGDAGTAAEGNVSLGARVLVACITSTGTLHLFLCDVPSATLISSREKSLCPPPGSDFPFAFAALFPQPTITGGRCALHVLRWREGGLHTTASLLNQSQRRSEGGTSAPPSFDGGHPVAGQPAQARQRHGGGDGAADIRLIAFDVRITPPPPRTQPPLAAAPSRAGSEGTWRGPSSLSATSVIGGHLTCRPYHVFEMPFEV